MLGEGPRVNNFALDLDQGLCLDWLLHRDVDRHMPLLLHRNVNVVVLIWEFVQFVSQKGCVLDFNDRIKMMLGLDSLNV